MILTLTLNPAVDRNITVDKLVFEDRAYIHATRESAGGRGINASYVIESFGGKTVAVAVCGGKNGRNLEEHLLQFRFPSELVRVKQDVRTNFTISDRQGLAIKLNEFGPTLSAAELARVERLVKGHLPQISWLMLCGSLPPGVPSDFYGRLITLAKKQGVKTLVDTDGEPLQVSLDDHPTVVCPNQSEAERLLGRALITRAQFQDAAERIRAMGAENVVLSLGSRGAMGGLQQGGLWEAIPPAIDAICPIGAGDALAAAFAWSMERSDDFTDALRWGVAAGSASARLPGVSFASLDQTREMYRNVTVRPVAG